jgi:hypothetical protein
VNLAQLAEINKQLEAFVQLASTVLPILSTFVPQLKLLIPILPVLTGLLKMGDDIAQAGNDPAKIADALAAHLKDVAQQVQELKLPGQGDRGEWSRAEPLHLPANLNLINLPQLQAIKQQIDSLIKQGVSKPIGEQRRSSEVRLGASAPPSISVGETFVARFAAYTDANRDKVRAIIEREALRSLRPDLDHCRWRTGTKVTVRLECEHATVSNSVQTFSWDGSYKILRFDVTVADNIPGDTLILRFDVAVEGMPIISLRPELQIRREQQYGIATLPASFVEVRAPKTAFASYAAKDRREVAGRIRSLEISTGIDVFFDRQSIRPGEKWKEKLRNEIGSRDIFWLFWSRKAMKSKWVDWEWRTALAAKTIDGIQPHPLEPSDLAPAPKELSALQFGSMYEWYIHHLQDGD